MEVFRTHIAIAEYTESGNIDSVMVTSTVINPHSYMPNVCMYVCMYVCWRSNLYPRSAGSTSPGGGIFVNTLTGDGLDFFLPSEKCLWLS